MSRPLVTDLLLLKPPAAQTREPGITVKFFGTTTLALSDGSTTILTDGFFSRPSIGQLASGPVKPDLGRIKAALMVAGLARLDAVLVAHSHHDHAMDAPYVAHLTGAKLVGSRSSTNIARGVNFAESQIVEIADGSMCRFGAFTITIFQTPHSWPNLIPGTIKNPLGRSAWVWAYKDGGNFTFHIAHPWGNVLVVPSYGVRTEWTIPLRTQVVFLGVGGSLRDTRKLQRYWTQFVTDSAATTVHPIHWDDFFTPIDAEDTQDLSAVESKLAKLRSLAKVGQNVSLLKPWEEELLFAPGRRLSPSDRASTEGCDPNITIDPGGKRLPTPRQR